MRATTVLVLLNVQPFIINDELGGSTPSDGSYLSKYDVGSCSQFFQYRYAHRPLTGTSIQQLMTPTVTLQEITASDLICSSSTGSSSQRTGMPGQGPNSTNVIL